MSGHASASARRAPRAVARAGANETFADISPAVANGAPVSEGDAATVRAIDCDGEMMSFVVFGEEEDLPCAFCVVL